MANCLVTGGAGFIGSHVAYHLIQTGHDVTVLDDLMGGFRENVPEGARFVKGSCSDVDTVDRLFFESRYDRVYHLAAYASEQFSHWVRRFNYENNVLGSVNLINAAIRHDIDWFVFASSTAVYGSGQVPFIESVQPVPDQPYGIAKYAVELDLACAGRLFGLPYTIFRPHNVYGERQHLGDRYRNVVGIFMLHAMQGLPMPVHGDGLQTRGFSYISDVAPIIADSPDYDGSEGEVFNVGADGAYTVLELAHAVAATLGVEPNIEHVEALPGVRHSVVDHAKVRKVFGERETVPLEVGLHAMAAWARETRPVESPKFESIDLTLALPEYWT